MHRFRAPYRRVLPPPPRVPARGWWRSPDWRWGRSTRSPGRPASAAIRGMGSLSPWTLPSLVELLGLSRDEVRIVNPSSFEMVALGGLIGLFDGLALGVGEGITAGTQQKFFRAVGAGAITGLLGGVVGLACGQWFYQTILS